MARPDFFSDVRIKSSGFSAGVKGLLGLPSDVRGRLRTALPSVPDQLQDINFVADKAKNIGVDAEQYKLLAAFSRMILSYVESDKISVNDVTDIFQESLGDSLSTSDKEAVEKFFLMTDGEKEASRNVEAFYFGDSFNFAEFKALVVHGDGDSIDDPQFGGAITINYMDSAATPKAISLNISEHELSELSEVIAQSLRLLGQMKSKYREK